MIGVKLCSEAWEVSRVGEVRQRKNDPSAWRQNRQRKEGIH